MLQYQKHFWAPCFTNISIFLSPYLFLKIDPIRYNELYTYLNKITYTINVLPLHILNTRTILSFTINKKYLSDKSFYCAQMQTKEIRQVDLEYCFYISNFCIVPINLHKSFLDFCSLQFIQ